MFHKFLLSLCQGLKSLLKAVLYFIGGLLVLVALLEIYVVFEKTFYPIEFAKDICLDNSMVWDYKVNRCCVQSSGEGKNRTCQVYDDDKIFLDCIEKSYRWDHVNGKCCKKWADDVVYRTRNCLEYDE